MNWEKVFKLLFPERCVHCRGWGNYLCANCWSGINFLRKQRCPGCQKAVVLGLYDHGCSYRSYLDQLYSIGWYRGVLRSLLREFKFKSVRDLRKVVKELIAGTVAAEDISVWDGALVSYVPLHQRRLGERGYNQSRIIAQVFSRVMGFNLRPLLKRTRNTQRQARLSKRERRKNIKGAFSCLQGPDGKTYPRIILVDDVYTTGSTLQECAKVLKRFGFAEQVFGFTLARG